MFDFEQFDGIDSAYTFQDAAWEKMDAADETQEPPGRQSLPLMAEGIEPPVSAM